MSNTGFYLRGQGFFNCTLLDGDTIITLGSKFPAANIDPPLLSQGIIVSVIPYSGDPCTDSDGNYLNRCLYITYPYNDGSRQYAISAQFCVISSTTPILESVFNKYYTDFARDFGINLIRVGIGTPSVNFGNGVLIGYDVNMNKLRIGVQDRNGNITWSGNSGTIYDNGTCSSRDIYSAMFFLDTEGTNNGFITDYLPNKQGGTSSTGGGDGAFEISSDIIEEFDVSKLISAISTGFMRAYAIKPNEMQLIRDLATYMWTSDFIDNLKKLWGDPMQVIMGLSAIPVTPARGGVQNVVLGNVQSPVAMPPATSQYVVHNCGSIAIKKYWGNYLDYKYTKASIYLPFIGGQELDIQKVMGKTLSLAYIIDIVSGACSAQLVADGSVIGNWQGSCAMGLPISAENFSRYYVGALTSAGAGLIKGASAGPIGALAGAITGAAVNSAINPPHVEMNGNVSGAGGYMSCRRPYIQLTLPRQSLAEIYNEIEGYPCNVTYTLGDLTGYTVVANVHLEGIIATADELEEIEELLKGGVIF